MQNIQARALQIRDLPQYRRLWSDYCEHFNVAYLATEEATDRLISQLKSGRIKCVVVTDSVSVFGFANYITHATTYCSNDVMYLEDLYVDAAVRMRGVGKAIIEQLKIIAKEDNVEFIHGITGYEHNESTVNFYKRIQAKMTPFYRFIIK